jgi:hypothetical protein
MMISVEGLEAAGADMELVAKNLPNAVRASLRGTGGKILAREMRMLAPSRTGNLRSNIRVHADGDGVLVGYQGELAAGSKIVGARNQKGAWIESGTKPHPIRARKARSLFFLGTTVEEVIHPGTRGKKIVPKAMKESEEYVLDDVARKLDEIGSGGSKV